MSSMACSSELKKSLQRLFQTQHNSALALYAQCVIKKLNLSMLKVDRQLLMRICSCSATRRQ